MTAAPTIMIRIFLGAIVLVAATPSAHAAGDQGYYATVSVGSHHFDRQPDGDRYNEINPGVGLELAQPPFYTIGDITLSTSLAAGYYHNSVRRPSFYAVGGLEGCTPVATQTALCAGVQAGAVTGYQDTVTPAAIAYAKARYDRAFAKLGLIPPVSTDSGDVPATLLLQLGYRFY